MSMCINPVTIHLTQLVGAPRAEDRGEAHTRRRRRGTARRDATKEGSTHKGPTRCSERTRRGPIKEPRAPEYAFGDPGDEYPPWRINVA
jgi:hypothetical protein